MVQIPEIIEYAEHVDLPGLKKEDVIELKLEGNKKAELYDKLLPAQCHALHKAMPFLFEPIDDETELLLPDKLLHSDSPIGELVAEIPAEDWQEVEGAGRLIRHGLPRPGGCVVVIGMAMGLAGGIAVALQWVLA